MFWIWIDLQTKQSVEHVVQSDRILFGLFVFVECNGCYVEGNIANQTLIRFVEKYLFVSSTYGAFQC